MNQAFHDHLDVCEQCRTFPRGLCANGARLLFNQVAPDPLPPLDEPPAQELPVDGVDWTRLLELDGPVVVQQRIAAFLRLYARRIRKGERWDIPETMASAYESAASVLEAVAAAGALVEPPAQEPKASRIVSPHDSERKRVAERLGQLSDRLLVVSKAAKDIDAIRQDLHMFYAEEVAELVDAVAGALVEPPKPFVAPGEFNTAEHWPAKEQRNDCDSSRHADVATGLPIARTKIAALVAREPLEQLIGKWRGSVAYVIGSTTYVNGTFSACAKDLEAALRAADQQQVTRFEVIDESGRAFTRWGCRIELRYQDEGRTLKVFVRDDPAVPNRPASGWLATLRAAVPQPAPADPSCTVPESAPAETPMILKCTGEKPNDSTRTTAGSAPPAPDPEAK